MNRRTFEPVNRKVRASYHRQQERECQVAGLMGFAEWHYDMAEELDPTPREATAVKPANNRRPHARNNNNATRGVNTPHATKGDNNGKPANSIRNPHGARGVRGSSANASPVAPLHASAPNRSARNQGATKRDCQRIAFG